MQKFCSFYTKGITVRSNRSIKIFTVFLFCLTTVALGLLASITLKYTIQSTYRQQTKLADINHGDNMNLKSLTLVRPRLKAHLPI